MIGPVAESQRQAQAHGLEVKFCFPSRPLTKPVNENNQASGNHHRMPLRIGQRVQLSKSTPTLSTTLQLQPRHLFGALGRASAITGLGPFSRPASISSVLTLSSSPTVSRLGPPTLRQRGIASRNMATSSSDSSPANGSDLLPLQNRCNDSKSPYVR